MNIFNLEGGETMLARDNEKFRTQGENWTHDPPNTISDVPTTEPEGREFDSGPGLGNFLSPGRARFLLLPSWKCSLAFSFAMDDMDEIFIRFLDST